MPALTAFVLVSGSLQWVLSLVHVGLKVPKKYETVSYAGIMCFDRPSHRMRTERSLAPWSHETAGIEGRCSATL